MAATYGIDRTNTSTYGTANTYIAYFDTPLYRVGTPLNKRMFTEIEMQFARKLAANECIRIQYRATLSDSFTTIGTWVHTAASSSTLIGAVDSHSEKTNIPATEFLQLRIYLVGTTTSPQLKTIILR